MVEGGEGNLQNYLHFITEITWQKQIVFLLLFSVNSLLHDRLFGVLETLANLDKLVCLKLM